MASSSTIRRNHTEDVAANAAVLDLETRATRGDHQALRLWLRLLSCTVRIENHIRLRLRREFNTTLPRFDLMAQLERSAGGLRMNELSQRLMVSGGNVTGITDQLEREKLVTQQHVSGTGAPDSPVDRSRAQAVSRNGGAARAMDCGATARS